MLMPRLALLLLLLITNCACLPSGGRDVADDLPNNEDDDAVPPPPVESTSPEKETSTAPDANQKAPAVVKALQQAKVAEKTLPAGAEPSIKKSTASPAKAALKDPKNEPPAEAPVAKALIQDSAKKNETKPATVDQAALKDLVTGLALKNATEDAKKTAEGAKVEAKKDDKAKEADTVVTKKPTTIASKDPTTAFAETTETAPEEKKDEPENSREAAVKEAEKDKGKDGKHDPEEDGEEESDDGTKDKAAEDEKAVPAPKEGDKNVETAAEDKNKKGSEVVKQEPLDVELYSDSHFFSIMMFFLIIIAAAYMAFHNKRKLIAMIMEGKKAGGRGGRVRYHRLAADDDNFEQRNVIY